MRRLWWHPWFEGPLAGDAETLQMLLAHICQQEIGLACHLADRARSVRFAPHRLSLQRLAARERQHAQTMAREIGGGATVASNAFPVQRTGTLTAAKLIQDLAETEDLYALYRQASRLTSDGILRGRLEGMAAEADRSAQTIRRILGRLDRNVRDRPS